MAARDVLYTMAIVFMLGVGYMAVHYVMNIAVNNIVSEPTINSSSRSVDMFNVTKTMSNRLDYAIFGIFMALSLGIIITGWYIAGDPIFMFAYFIVIVLGVILAMILSNVWEDISLSTVFVSSLPYFPITNFILLYLPFMVAALGFIGITVMFAKPGEI